MAAVHGGEIESIVGIVNLIALLETGRDLRGKPWPEIIAAAAKLDHHPDSDYQRGRPRACHVAQLGAEYGCAAIL